MVKVNFKHVPCGERFTYEGEEYTKGSHNVGNHIVNGQMTSKRFKKLAVVDTKLNLWDFVPPIR